MQVRFIIEDSGYLVLRVRKVPDDRGTETRGIYKKGMSNDCKASFQSVLRFFLLEQNETIS